MNQIIERLLASKVLKWGLLTIIIVFSLIRFVNLNADFPLGITDSGVLYTDEGWYAASAVRHVLTGNWYLPGDINTVIALPFGQLLHRASFALFGLGLTSARITVVLSYITITIFTALLIQQEFGDFAALLSALLLSTNYIGFAYSRLATMDLLATAFVVLSLFVANRNRGNSLMRLIFASVVLSLAILTKATALFAIPLLLFLAWKSGSKPKESIILVVTSLSILLVLVGGYRVLSERFFPEDYVLFNRTTIAQRFTNFQAWRWNLLKKLPGRIERIGKGFLKLSTGLTIIALVASKDFRRSKTTLLLISYLLIYIGMLSLNTYSPPRYYLPLLVPLAGLSATACSCLITWAYEKNWRIVAPIPVILILIIAAGEAKQSVLYLNNPEYSYITMMSDIGEIVTDREGSTSGILLFGDIADSISLELGTNAINTLLGVKNLESKLLENRPKYLVVHTSEIDELARTLCAETKLLGAWDVFENYYANGEQVRLLFVNWDNVHGE